ncbi:MAG: TonB family protein [Janthinobacterium lividum]
MNHSTRYCLLLAMGLVLGARHPAAAQEAKKVYAYAEQMPQLPGGGGQGAIQAAIQRSFEYPADALRDHVSGTVYLRFNVTETGRVAEAQVAKGLSPSVDAAALAAVRKLPVFVPGRQNGQAVTVGYVIPLTITPPNVPDLSGLSGEGSREVVEEVVPADKVYTFVEQMPALPGGGGQAAIVAAMQQQLVVPPDAVEGRVFTSFVVSPEGAVRDAKIVKGLSPSADAAVLAAVAKLPAFIPGKQNGRAVAVSFTIPTTIRLPNHVFEKSEVATRARFAAPGLYPYLQQHLQVPAVVAREKLHGLIGVDVVVLASGKIDVPTLTSHLCTSCDAEVLRLVQQFPAWVPARDHAGRAVPVRQHLSIPLPLPTAATLYTKPAQVLTYVAEPPTLLDGTPTQELGPLLAQTLHYPEVARREKITGTVQLEFLVDATGVVRTPHITQSLCVSCDQAILAALAALGPFVPGRQGEQPAAVRLQLTVPFQPAGEAASTLKK